MAVGSLTDYGEAKTLDYLFGGTAFTPGTYYFGLSTTTITDAGGNITEPAGSNYARVVVTNNATNFPAAGGTSPTTKHNGTAIIFNQATGNWGTVTDFFLADASSGGNIIAYGVLDVPKTPTSGDTVQFAINGLTITCD